MFLKNKVWFRDLVFISIISLVITTIWFRHGVLYGGGESGLYFNDLNLTLKNSFSVWLDSYVGVPSLYQIINIPFYFFSYLLFILKIPGWLIQAFINFILLSTGMISMYFLLQKTLSKNNCYSGGALFGALFYLFNLYSMSQIWSRGLYQQFIPFASFPLMFLLAYLALEKLQTVYILILLIASFIFSAGYTPANVLSFWIMIGIEFLYFFWFYRKKFNYLLKSAILFFVLVFGWIGIHSSWIVGYFLFANNLYLSNPSVRNEGLGTLLTISRYSPLTSVLRLVQDYYFNSNLLYGDFYPSSFFKITSWITPILFLFSLSAVKRAEKMYLWMILLFVALFICLGASLPLGFIFVWFFQIFPILELFRNPYEKFGIVLLISYTPFIALGYLKLSEFLKLRFRMFQSFFKTIIIFIIFFLLVWPMWTGLVITTKDNRNFVNIPSYYQELKDWMEKHNKINNRIAMLPFLPGEGVTLEWNGRIYSGIDPSINILDYSIISWVQNYPYIEPLLKEVYKDINKIDITSIFGLLRAKYLVIRDDVLEVNKRDLQQEESLLHAVYAPQAINEQMPVICPNQASTLYTENHLIFICQIPVNLSDWRRYHYLHLLVKTDKPAALDIALRDQNNERPRWDGTTNPDFRTYSSNLTNLFLDLDLYIYSDEKFNPSVVKSLEIYGYSNPEIKDSLLPTKVEVIAGHLDSGKKTDVDNYNFIKQFGRLRLYQLKKYQDFPDITTLADLFMVDNFSQMFKVAANLSVIDGSRGYMLRSQNDKFTPLTSFSRYASKSVTELSSTKYLVNLESKENYYLALHKTFNTLWKVIPNVSEGDLKGGFINNIRLIQKQTLSEKNHFIVNGYANGWKLDQQSNEYAVVFIPQIITEILIYVSVVFLLFILFLLFCLLKINKVKSK